MSIIRKAVFPVAGLGTRFLPATKANPKEMLPIVDKPLIQYAVEEAIVAGVTEVIFITSSSKRAIEDHFDSNFELETTLDQRGKMELLKLVQDILPEGVSCSYVRQPKQLGLGHAVLCARPLIGEETFAVLLADDLIDGAGEGCLHQMMQAYSQHHKSVVAVETVSPQDVDKYGIVAVEDLDARLSRMTKIVEKPKQSTAPSHLGVVGRYILTPHIFKYLERKSVGAGGEIQLTDAIAQLMIEEGVYAYHFDGKRYDCGSKLGYLEATVAYGLKHAEVGPKFAELLRAYVRG